MKKILKLKFLSLMFGLPSFLFLSASCGGTKTEVQKEVLFVHGFSANNERTYALEQIAASYNKFIQDKPQGYEDALKVTLSPIGSGYNGVTDKVINSIKAKNTREIPSLFIHYPSLESKVASFKMGFNFTQDGFTKEDFGIDKIPQKLVEAQNSQIEFLESGPDKIYLLPNGNSSELKVYDMPAFYYFIEVLQKNGIKTADNAETKAFIEKIKAVYDKKPADVAVVKKYFIAQDLTDQEKKPLESFIFDYTKMNQLEYVLDLVEVLSKVFSKGKDTFFLGFDEISNSIYSSIFSRTGSDLSKFLFSISEKKVDKKDNQGKEIPGQFEKVFREDLTSLKDKNSTPNKIFKEIIDKILPLIKKGYIYISGGTAENYSSSYATSHKMPLSFSSTSGYKYYIKKGEEKPAETLQEDEAFYDLPIQIWNDKNLDDKKTVIVQGGQIFGISKNPEIDKATRLFAKWLGTSKNWTLYQKDGSTVVVPITPLDFYARMAGYVYVSNEIKDQSSDDYRSNSSIKLLVPKEGKSNSYKTVVDTTNPARNLIVKQLKGALDSPDKFAYFTDPSTKNSSDIRGGIKTLLNGSPTKDNYNFEKFLDDLIKLIISKNN